MVQRRNRKSASGGCGAGRVPTASACQRNQRWSMDLVADSLADGRRIRVLTVVDDFTRECLARQRRHTSFPGVQVARVLDRLGAQRGLPETITVAQA